MRINASARLLAAKADEGLARKYIRQYAGIDADDLRFVPNSWNSHESIMFEMPSSQTFHEAAKNLEKHFGKPDSSFSTTFNKQYTWKLDPEKSIHLSEHDREGHHNTITLYDRRELTEEERIDEARRKRALLYPQSHPKGPVPSNMSYRNGRRYR